ncbi:MAG: divergent PAP2 family protein [Candidatus Komeilibacteria bacterium]|nr:divergent PAP2 family protein [Candidatus Komeilibacteria bacterium]
MPLFVYPLLIFALVQIIKLIIETIHGRFSWNHLFSNGGMPSSHSAFITSAATVIALAEGIGSPLFVLACAVALIVVWDSFTIRYQLGFHGLIINRLVKELPDMREYKYPLLSERLGHKLGEVIVGVIIGIGVTLLLLG